MTKIWKTLQAIDRLHHLIKRKATGTPEELAQKFNVCRASIFLYLDQLRDIGAEIAYCHERKSYYYTKDFSLTGYLSCLLGNRNDDIKGGKIIFKNYF